MGKSRIIVKRYKNEREFQQDAKKMIRKGYEVQAVTSEQPRSGITRIFLLGIFAGIFKPKPVLIVTYGLSSKGNYPVAQEILHEQKESGYPNISKW